jgi:hypothetical protein
VLNCNNTFVSVDKMCTIKSQCRLLPAAKHIMKKLQEGEIGPTHIYNFYEQWSGGDQHVNFLPLDCNNYLSLECKKKEVEDA